MVTYLRQRQQLLPTYCAALVVVILTVMWFLAAKASAIAVIIDGEKQFLVKSSADVEQILSQMELDKEAETMLPLELANQVEFEEVLGFQSQLLPLDQVAQVLEDSIEFKAAAATIMVNGMPVASLLSTADAEQLVNQFIKDYGTAEPGEKLLNVGFEEDVQVVEQTVALSQIVSTGQAYNLITTGTPNPEKYIVKDGDCLWLIARRNDMLVEDIKKANHLEKENLALGQELILVKSKPLLNVLATVEGDKMEAIPYETSVVVDQSAPSTIRVKQAGSDGEKHIWYQATKKNGILADRQITNEQILKNPVARILVKGNQVVQVASRGSGGGSGQFDWPVYGPISQYYRGGHPAIDITGKTGTTIRAADGGYVAFAGWDGGYGRCLVIDHGNGYTTRYAHCNSLSVSEGQHVSKGQAIATLGSTGHSTGPHLHFEVARNGSTLNPLSVLR